MSHRWSSRWRRIAAVVLSLAVWPAAQATFYVSPEFSFSSTTSILGLATEAGQITGGPLTGQMALRTYEFSGSDPAFGPVGVAAVVPEPAAWVMALAGVAAAAAARRIVQRPRAG